MYSSPFICSVLAAAGILEEDVPGPQSCGVMPFEQQADGGNGPSPANEEGKEDPRHRWPQRAGLGLWTVWSSWIVIASGRGGQDGKTARPFWIWTSIIAREAFHRRQMLPTAPRVHPALFGGECHCHSNLPCSVGTARPDPRIRRISRDPQPQQPIDQLWNAVRDSCLHSACWY